MHLGRINEEAIFNCEITDHPLNSIHWLHNGIPIANQLRKVLKIENVKVTDQGMYQCIAKNDEMAAQASAELKLSGI